MTCDRTRFLDTCFTALTNCLLVLTASAGVAAVNVVRAAATDESSDALQEITVTATRQSEPLSKVPVSIAVLTKEDMDSEGVKSITDVIRLTPGIVFNAGYDGGGSATIAIRGVGSNAGASPTGIYIDDVPIQVRQLGYYAGSIYPDIFDLDRVEILRGPQGTLFGAGSEGGTVRFISPDASLTTFSAYARAEALTIEHGSSGYEGGLAVGGPIIDNTLGFRLSAFYRHDGGYIDRVQGAATVVDPTGASYGQSTQFAPTGPTESSVNWSDTTALRGALTFAPTDTLRIKPSLYYQDQYFNDPTNEYFLSSSSPTSERFSTPQFNAAAPTAANGFTPLLYPNSQHGKGSLFVAALPVEWTLGGVTLYSTTSYLDQRKTYDVDNTLDYTVVYASEAWPTPGQRAVSHQVDEQKVFTQEVRLQSNDPTARVKWLVGAFFSKLDQGSTQYIEENFFSSASSFFGIPSATTPFGPGYSNFQNIWGTPMLNQSGSYFADAQTHEKQEAVFGQTDIKLTDRLTLTAGVRVAHDTLNYTLLSLGPENNLNAPFGAPCPTVQPCVYGQGVFAPQFPSGSEGNSENAVTPKVGLGFQADENNLYYVSASKGFRPGGAQLPLPTQCDSDLSAFGYVNSAGQPTSPQKYSSDSLWSYEIGSKNRLLGGTLSVATSAYVIQWKNIQTSLLMPTCGFSFVNNIGAASIKGFDLAVEYHPISDIKLGGSVSYSDATLSTSLESPSGPVFTKGSRLPHSGAPWTIIGNAQYELPFLRSMKPYIRTDYVHNSAQRPTGLQVPGVVDYDPLLIVPGANTLVNGRIGVRLGGADVSLFANNLFDAHPLLSDEHYSAPYAWFATTFQPRTIGVTATYRY